MKQKLNQTVVDEARFDLRRPGLQFIWDTSLRGFGVQLLRTKKSYVINHTLSGRKVIGDAAEMKYKDAAAKAKNYLGLLGMGVNPFAAATPLQQGEMTLRQLADKYLAKPRKRPLRERTVTEFNRQINLYLKDFAHRPFRAITRDDIERLWSEIQNRPNANGTPPAAPKTVQAQAVMVTLRSLFTYAVKMRLHDDDPTMVVEHLLKPEKKDRRDPTRKHKALTDEQLKELSLVLRNWHGNPFHPLLFRFLLLTGLRVNKALAMKWDYVQEDRLFADTSEQMSKAHRPMEFPMTPQLRSLLDELHELSFNEWLFPSPTSPDGRMTCSGHPINKLNERLNFTTTNHSFKETFVTVGYSVQPTLDRGAVSALADHALPSHITDDYAVDFYTRILPYTAKAIHAELDTRMRPALKAVSTG